MLAGLPYTALRDAIFTHGRGAERPVRERAPAEIAVIKLDSSGPTSLSARLDPSTHNP
jgi:hypothetical protein